MKFALAGNPNSGKTTLFNALTGSTAHVGNWPGVTVDRKEGTYKYKDTAAKTRVTIIDLPGIYSLSPYTPEEIVARNYIVDENPDLIINIVDATNLERNLYLSTQVLETDCPVVIALNMMDTVRKNGAKINTKILSDRLGVPVVEISALKAEGLKPLMDIALKEASKPREGKSVIEHSFMQNEFNSVVSLLQSEGKSHPVFHAVKAIEGDALEMEALTALLPQIEEQKASIVLDEDLGGDFEAAVADIRYTYITDHLSKAITRTQKSGQLTRSDKIDKILTNRWLGIPIFLVIMFGVFHLTFGEWLFGIEGVPTPGGWLFGLMEQGTAIVIDFIAGLLQSAGAADWVYGLVVDGLLTGVGAVLSFLPYIMMLFLFLSIMEDTGYMARAAFLMDRLLRRFGLSGKAFMPMLMGFGCSVPAMMGTRTLENEKERRLTVMLLPFFSCGAKLPIWATFTAAIFPANADLVVFGIYLLGIVVAILAAIILKKTILKGDAAPFIMELPAYHSPKIKNLLIHLWEKLKGFIIRASTIIAGATIVIWFLSNFSFGFQMVEANSADSILGILGNFIRPVFIPLGFAGGDVGWKAVVAIITGLIAKEMVVSTLGVLYNPGVEGDALEDEGAKDALLTTLAATFSPLAAISFMAFNLLSVPCMAAVAAAHGEMRSKKWTFITIGFWILTAYTVSFLIFNVGSLLGFGG